MKDVRSSLAAAMLVVALAALLYALHPQFFVKDDFQSEFLPASREVARAWSSGSFPLLSPHSWFCSALAAEYQYGVFSLFRALLDNLVWLLPLSLTAKGAWIFIAHAAAASAGGFLLARSYGARSSLAMMVAVIAGLNGWILWWGTTWLPAIAAFAWIPWYWLGLRVLTTPSRWNWLIAPFALYLLLTAGSPYTLAMALVVALLNFASALLLRKWRAALLMVGTSFLGLCLAAPALLMLLEYFPATSRSAGTFSLGAIWVITPAALSGFIIPAITTVWPVFVGSLPHTAVEMVGAFVPLAAIAALGGERLARLRRPSRPAPGRRAGCPADAGTPALLFALLIVLLVAMMLPSPTPLRWSFHWLPLFHLVAAIAGACALENVRRAWMWGIGLVAIALLVALRTDHGLRTTLAHAALIVVLCVAWAILERRGSRLSDAMPATITIVMIVATFATFSRHAELPTWRYDQSLLDPRPLDPARRYLSMVDLSDIMGIDERERFTRGLNPELRPGNMAMLAGLDFVNGYSPLGPIGLKNIFEIYVHGAMKRERAEHILERESGPNQLLHHMGVDGLIVPRALVARHAASLARNGWRPAAELATCLVLHRQQRLDEPIFGAARAWKVATPNEGYAAIFLRRTASLPVVLLHGSGEARYGRRSIGDVEEGRHHSSFRVRGKGPVALVVFRRPWLPGWRATIDGRPLDVMRADMLMPAVEIPADAEGEVRLVYRPRGLVVGTVIAALALMTIACGGLLARMRHSPS